MAAVTAAMVKELRESTGAGMMECKKALTETDGDMDKAIDWLREKGLAQAAKKAGRIAAEGAVVAYMTPCGCTGALVEVNCETDFVANTDNFKNFANAVAKHVALANPADLDELMKQKFVDDESKTIEDMVSDATVAIGEKITVRRFARYETEGVVSSYIHMGGRIGVLIEVNCETDFVANGEPFGNFVKGVAAVVAKENPADVDALMGCPWVTGNGTVKDAKDELFLAIRENMSIRRFARIADGFSVPYVHMKGKIGVIVNLTVEGCDATEIGKDIAMQIAALNPRFWDKSQVTQDVLDEEKEVMLGQMANDPKMANKPDQVKEKIVMGKLNKFYAENCLLQQAFVKDGDVSVEQYMNNAAKALGGKVSFNTAVRFEKGEGIEKKQENFAAEIASMVNGNK